MLEEAYSKIKNFISFDKFKLEVLAYINQNGVDEEYATNEIIKKYNKSTVLKLNIDELSDDYSDSAVSILATIRAIYNVQEYKNKKVLYALLCDNTGFVNIKLENESIDELIYYNVGTTLRVSGILKVLKDGRRLITDLSNIEYVDNSPMNPPLESMHKVKVGTFDTYLRVLNLRYEGSRKPHLILVCDENYKYVIKTWNIEVLDNLNIGSYYTVRGLRKSFGEYSKQMEYSASLNTQFIEAKNTIVSVSESIKTDCISTTINEGIVLNYELMIVDISQLQYTKFGNAEKSKKYTLQGTDETILVDFVDWNNKYTSDLELHINSYIRFKNVSCRKKYKNIEIVVNFFSEIELV